MSGRERKELMRWTGLFAFVVSLSLCVANKVEEKTRAEVSKLNFKHCLQTCDMSPRVGTCVAACWYQRGIEDE